MLEFLKGINKKLAPEAAIVSANDNHSDDDVIELPKPIVLINIADDDTTRGDTKGRIGLGHSIGRQLETKTVYADEETLREKYPDMDDASYQTKLTKYLTDLGCTPDMILGFHCDDTLRKLGKDPDDVVLYSEYNESLSICHLEEHHLVSHHLTQEDLESAGQEFDERHPDIKRPIITIFIAIQDSDDDIELFSERLTKITKHYSEATIYLCGGRRNEISDQQATEKKLNKKLAKKGQSEAVDVISWEFSKEGYNPYKGLIARSDHFIVWGGSQSLVSEPLFAGKTVHTFRNYANGLEKKGLVVDFNGCNPKKPFQTRHFPPVNLTDDLATKLIEDTTAKRKYHAKRFLDQLRSREIPSDWRRHLINIRFRPEAIQNVPSSYLEDEKFLIETLKINSFCLHFLPDEVKERPMVAKLTIETNPDAFGMLAEKFRDDRAFVESFDIPIIKLFPYLSERLRSDKSFIQAHIGENPAIFTHLPKQLRDDEALARTAVFANEDSASVYLSVCSDRLRDDEEFVCDVIDFSPGAYVSASDRLKEDPDVAKLAIERRPSLFHKTPQGLRSNKELVRIVAKEALLGLCGADESLAEDEDFMLELIELNPGVVTNSFFIREHCSSNKKIMLAAIAINENVFLYVDNELKNDPHFIRECAKMGVHEAWDDLDDELADDEEFVLEAMQVNPACFQHASERVRGLKHVAETAVKNDSSMLCYVSEELQADIDFARIVLNSEFTYTDFFRCSDLIKNNEDFVIECMQKFKDYRFFMHASPRVRDMEEVAITAIEIDVRAVKSINANLMDNPDFINLFVQNYAAELKEKGCDIEHHTFWLKIGCCNDYDFGDIPGRYKKNYSFVRQLVDLRPDLGENPEAREVLERGPSQYTLDEYDLATLLHEHALDPQLTKDYPAGHGKSFLMEKFHKSYLKAHSIGSFEGSKSLTKAFNDINKQTAAHDNKLDNSDNMFLTEDAINMVKNMVKACNNIKPQSYFKDPDQSCE